MLVLLACLLIQPNSDLFTKLDALYESQVTQLQADIESLRKSKGDPQKLSALRQELAYLQKNYAITLPLFDFNKGVKEGDVGTIGYYMGKIRVPVPNGNRGGYTYVDASEKMARDAKVIRIQSNGLYLDLLPRDEGVSVIVKGMSMKGITEEKVISLAKYIYEYAGKDEAMRIKAYNVIGNEADFLAWKKDRIAQAKVKK